MYNIFKKTFEKLTELSFRTDTIIVSYSGGKDSLAVLDMCSKVFERVICFYMYLVPGLQCVEAQLDFARQRYNVQILQYPHWLLFKLLKNMVYCPQYPEFKDIKEIRIKDIYAAVRKDTGVKYIATGAKRADSLWRRRYTTTASETHKDVIMPLLEWNKFDVLAYLRHNDIPIPESSGIFASGIDLSSVSLNFLYEKHPEDFKLLCKLFPYAEAVIWRKKFYGL